MRKYNKYININSRQNIQYGETWHSGEANYCGGILYGGSDYYTVIWLPYTDKKYSDLSKNLYYNKTILPQFTFNSFIFYCWGYLYCKAKLQRRKDHIFRTNLFIVASTVCLFQWNNMGNIGKNDMLLWINNIIQIWYRASQSTGQGYFLQHFLINIPIVCFLSNLIFSYHFHINIYHWQIYQSLDLR